MIDKDRIIAIITIACEASNQDQTTRAAVAATFFNRLKDGRFGKTIAAVCLKRFQYSEWNGDAADNANLERVANLPDDHSLFAQCSLAYDVADAGHDYTLGATHFYDPKYASPTWADVATFTVQIGAFRFYKNVP